MELRAGPLKRRTKLINLQLYSQRERSQIKPEVKEKTLIVTVLRYKGLQEATMNNYTPRNLTSQKKMDKLLETYNLPRFEL